MQGMRTTLLLDPHPLQPSTFGSWHIPSMLLIFSYSNLYLTFHKVLCMVWIATIALKSGLKMCLEKFKNENLPTRGRWTPLPLDPILYSLGPLCLGTYHIHYWCSLFQPFIQSFVWFLITTKALKSGLKMRLARFKNQKFPTQGKGTSLPLDPHPLQPWLFLPRHVQVHYWCFPIPTFILPFIKSFVWFELLQKR